MPKWIVVWKFISPFSSFCVPNVRLCVCGKCVYDITYFCWQRLVLLSFTLFPSLSLNICLFVAFISSKFARTPLFGCVHFDSVCGSVGMISRWIETNWQISKWRSSSKRKQDDEIDRREKESETHLNLTASRLQHNQMTNSPNGKSIFCNVGDENTIENQNRLHTRLNGIHYFYYGGGALVLLLLL